MTVGQLKKELDKYSDNYVVGRYEFSDEDGDYCPEVRRLSVSVENKEVNLY